jgi:DNA-binding beta-propeller fold protein YncE
MSGAQTIQVQVSNPDLTSGSYTIGGQTVALTPGTGGTFQIMLDPSLSGSQTLSINLGGQIYDTSFVVDTAARTVHLVRIVKDSGGVMTDPTLTPGSSMLDASAGEAVVGPPSDQSNGEMSSGPKHSRLLLGYYAGIDPVAPGAITNLKASVGPGAGETSLSWTATGNDANVGTAMVYDLRYSVDPITEANFSEAQTVSLSTYPALAGTRQAAVVSGLSEGTTYFFALKAVDGLLNASPLSPTPWVRTYNVAQSADLTNGHPTVTLLSEVPGITIDPATALSVPSVVLGYKAAAAQGLSIASQIYSIQTPLDPLPGGGTMQFYYDPTGLSPALQQKLRVYHLSAGSNSWVLVSNDAPDLQNDLLTVPVKYLSLFAVMLPDDVPPQVSLTTQDGRQFLSPAGSLFVSSAASFGFSAQDPPLGRVAGTGVASVRYRVDSATAPLTALAYSTETFRLSPGLHTIDYDAADAAGNVSPLKSAAVGVDGAAPRLLVSVAGGAYAAMPDSLIVQSTSSALSFRLVDPVADGHSGNDGAGLSSAAYSVDGGGYAVAGSSFALSLGLGRHALAVTAADAVGNVLDRSTAPYSLVVGDDLPPRTALAIGVPRAPGSAGAEAFVTRATSFTLTSADDLSAVGDGQGLGVAFQRLSVDGVERARFDDAAPGQGKVFVSSFSLTADSDGVHAVSYYAQDAIGNVEAVRVTTVAVDNAAPVSRLSVSSPVFGAYLSSSSVVSLAADDPTVGGVASGVEGVFYRDGGAAFAAYASTFTLAPGAHALDYYAQDRVGNAELARGATLYVDAVPPATTLSVSSEAAGGFVSSAAVFSFSATDPVSSGVASGVAFTRYSVDGSSFSAAPSSFTLTGLDGARAISYFSADQVGNAEVVLSTTVYLDQTAPVATAHVGSPSGAAADGVLYVTPTTPVSFTAVDPSSGSVASGVERIEVAVDSGAFSVYAATLTFAEGAHTVAYRAVDMVGNVSAPETLALRSDATPPQTVLAPSGVFFSTGSRDYAPAGFFYALISTDPVSGGVASGVSSAEYALDGEAFQVYSSTFALAAGARVVSFRSQDRVGNLELARSATVYVDAQPPVSSVAVGASSFTASGGELFVTPATPVSLSAADPDLPTGQTGSGVARIEVSVDSAAFSAYSSALTFTEGAHTLAYRAVDAVGNAEAVRTLSLRSDAVPPVSALAVSSPAVDGFVSTATVFSLSALDPVSAGVASGVSAILAATDGAALAPYAAPFALTGADGAHTISYRAVDEVANAEILRSTTVYLDQTAPVATAHVGAPSYTAADGALYVTPATPVAFTAVDPSSGSAASGVARIEVAVDGGAFAAYATPLTFAEGTHSVAYRAVDRVGNVSAARTLNLRSDATAPLTAFAPSAAFFTAGGHDYAPVGFTYSLAANDPVSDGVASGVAATRYALEGGAFQLYGSTFALTEGVRSVSFYSADNVGNAELTKSATVFVDATAPQTALSIGAPQFQGGALFVSTVTPFSLAAQDPVTNGVASGVRSLLAALDGAALAPYVSTITLTAPEGVRTLSWRADDNVGNTEALKAKSVFLDATAPETSLEVLGGRQAPGPDAATFYASSDTRFALISTDAASGVAFTRWQDGGGSFQLYLTTFSLAEGAHALAYQSQDRVANLEVPRSTTVLVDATAPVSTASVGSPRFTSADGTLFISTATPVTLAASDPALPGGRAGSGVARIETSVDGGAYALYSAPLTFSEGRHTLLYRAVDAVGNVEAARSLSLSADATPPVSALTIGQPQFALSSATILVSAVTPLGVAAQDPVVAAVASGVQASYYRVFDAAPSTAAFAVFTASFTLSPADGSKTVEFYSRDQVLNTEAVKSRTLLLDSTPPSVAFVSPHAGTGICSVVNGKVSVLGGVADAHLASYALEYAPGQSATTGYLLVSSGAAAVDGTLGVWDATRLSGWQTLRLTATDEILNVAVTTVTVFVGDPATLMVLGNDALFNMPQGVATDADGRIFVADTNDDEIQVFTATGAPVSLLGRSKDRDDRLDHDAVVSTATLVLNKPQGVAVNADGSLWIADTEGERVVKVSSAGAVLLSVGRVPGKKGDHDKHADKDDTPNFAPGSALGEFNHPSAVALDAVGNLFVADAENHRVQKLAPDGTPLLAFSLPPVPGRDHDDHDDKDDLRAPLGRPVAVAVDAAGRIYAADPDGGRALVFGATGQLLLSIPIPGGVDDGRPVGGKPDGIAVSPDGSCVLVADALSDRVFKFDALGNLTLTFGVHGRHSERKAGVRLNKPAGLAFAPDGTLLVADRNNDRVERYGTPNGKPTLVTPPDPDDPEFVVREVLAQDEGGKVERDDKAAVSIPAGALPDDMKISVSTMSPSSLADADHMQKVAESEGMKPGYAAVEYGPEGTRFKTPVTLTIPYDPNMVAMEGMSEDSLKVRYWDPKKGDWETMPSTVDKANHTVTAKTPHFSLYQVLGSTGTGAAPLAVSADPTFTLHDAYAFPNPVRGVRAVTLRVQPGLADSVVVRVYDLSGRKIHQSSDFRQSIIDDGNGKGNQYTYDHVWDVSGVGSGVYYYVITATKSGKSDIHKSGRVGVIK